MPTYEYLCSSCSKSFEVYQGIGDDPVDKCPDCGKKVKRLISGGSGFIMKGRSSFETPACGHDTPCCAANGSCGMANECGYEH